MISCKAAEIDDVFVQVILLRNRVRISSVFKKAQTVGTSAQMEVEKELSTVLGSTPRRGSGTSSYPIASAVGATLSSMFGYNKSSEPPTVTTYEQSFTSSKGDNDSPESLSKPIESQGSS